MHYLPPKKKKKIMNHKEQQILFQSETNKSRNMHFIERLKTSRRWILRMVEENWCRSIYHMLLFLWFYILLSIGC